MPLTTIEAAKDLDITYQPLLLAVITFKDGSVRRLSTHPLNTSEGEYQPTGISGFPHNNQDFLGRLSQQDLEEIQSQSEMGVDQLPSATLHIADADKTIFLNDERSIGRGFKGALMELFFVFADLDTGTFSSNYETRFVGICQQPSVDAKLLVVTATARMNLQKQQLPVARFQRRCIWVNPTTMADRAEANNEDSQFFECGETRDLITAPPCKYTTETCTQPNRRGNITFAPPPRYIGKSYTENKTNEGANSANESKYGEPIPLVYGTGWIEPPLQNRIGDGGNSIRFETVLCLGEVEGSQDTDPGKIQKVLVNDFDVPFVAYSPDKPTFRWQFVTPGRRDGGANADGLWGGKGDPYGSMATILVVVYGRAATGDTDPRVKVLMTGPKIRHYRRITSITVSGGQATVTFSSTNDDVASNDPIYTVEVSGCSYGPINGAFLGLTNWTSTTATFNAPGVPDGSGTGGFFRYKNASGVPPWVLLDLLTWCNLRYDDINIESFAKAAEICKTRIDYLDGNGATQQHERFDCTLILRDRRSAADVIRGLLRSFNANLTWYRGKLELSIRSTMAEQQPSPITGSNNASPVPSKLYSNTSANGYSAYDFDESSILRKPTGEYDFRIVPRPQADQLNRINFPGFQDKHNSWQTDSFSRTESEDISRMDQEFSGGIDVFGINSYDQSFRIGTVIEAEILRGNPTSDTRGTEIYEFGTSGLKAGHLRVGQICRISFVPNNLVLQKVRILKIQPSTNYETARIVASYHNDNWYTDLYGQGRDPKGNGGTRDRLDRPALPWIPGGVSTNQSFPASIETSLAMGFGIAPTYELRADGTALTRLELYGNRIVNQFSSVRPPIVPPQSNVLSSGGSLSGSNTAYFIQICAVDANGGVSAPSIASAAVITGPGSSNAAVVPTTGWDTGTTGWITFVGTNPFQLWKNSEGSGTPSSVLITSLSSPGTGVPDIEFDRFLFRAKRIIHSGVWGAEVASVATNTIKIAGATWSTNEWVGRKLDLLAKKNIAFQIPLNKFTVTGNTADTLTVTPNPASWFIESGDVFVMRATVALGSDAGGFYVEDSKWINGLSGGAGLDVDAERGNVLRIILGKGRGYAYPIKSNTATRIYIEGKWVETPDSTSVYIVEEPNWTSIESEVQNNPTLDSPAIFPLELGNYSNQTMLIQALTLDGGGNPSIEKLSPIREIYLFGTEGSIPAGALPLIYPSYSPSY